uniref:Uncharacterized protein n=1 Tax=Fagus sylvatica TaxID=28930 RepID=A0A2N9IT80_FAGSY
MYQLTDLNESGCTIRFPTDGTSLDEVYLGYSSSSSTISVPSLFADFGNGPQDTLDEQLLMAWAFLMSTWTPYPMGSPPLSWVTGGYRRIELCATVCVDDFPGANWHNSYTTRNHLDWITKDRIARIPWGLPEEGMKEGLAVSWHLSQFSKLYEGSSVRALYLAERVTTQLIEERNAVPIAPPPFILFPTLMLHLRTALPVEGGSRDIPLSPWSVTLRHSDGLLANNADLKEMIELVGSLKILVTQQYEDAYLRSYQADDDDDGGGGGVKMDEERGLMIRDDPTPMILAETLDGLDDLKDGTCHHFKGSPLLLQMWLYNHLGGLPREMKQSKRDNKVRALRLAVKLGISEEDGIDTRRTKRKEL